MLGKTSFANLLLAVIIGSSNISGACSDEGRSDGLVPVDDAAAASDRDGGDGASAADVDVSPTDETTSEDDAEVGGDDAALVRPRADAHHEANATLSSIPENTALDLGTFRDSEVGDDWDVIDDVGGMTYYATGHSILIFGGGHATTQTDVVYEFDFDELTWTAMYARTPDSWMVDDPARLNREYWAWINPDNPPEMRPLSRHTFDWLSVAETQGVMLMFMRGGFSTPLNQYFGSSYLPEYHISETRWSWIDDTEGTNETRPPSGYGGAATEYDPVSGNVIIVGQADYTRDYAAGIWVYDPVTRLSAHVVDIPANQISVDTLVYFPRNQTMYAFVMDPPGPGRVFEVELNRESWSSSSVTEVSDMANTPTWGYDTRGFAADTVNHVIGGVVQDGVFHAYDPLTRQWSSRTMITESPTNAEVGDLSHFCITFDPVNGVFILISDGAGPVWDTRRTWAYRYR